MTNFKKRFEVIKESLLDRNKHIKIVRTATYVVLLVVGLLMTVLNVFTIAPFDLLTITTALFSFVTLLCFLFSLIGPKSSKVAGVFFSIALVLMFSIFIISGKPEGFSAIWICLLPIASMLFFGRKIGSVLCGIMLVIMVILFNFADKIPVICNYQNIIGETSVYTPTFLVRFPILYISFYAVTFLLETIQEYQLNILEKVNNVNAKYSTHDQLTGLFNRKGFYDLLEKELKTRTYNKIGFIIFDLDFFKNLNDTFGHLAGDEVLIEFAKIIKEQLGNSIAACRWGGEEFLVCYLDDGINKADLENFRKTIQNHKFVSQNKIMTTTVSGGVFETNDKNYLNRSVWLKNADIALYKAKETGRNKIVYF